MTTTTDKPKIGALANWFGTNRSCAADVGRALEGCVWVGIPFCGSLAEVPHITARTILANDLHRHLINLARTVADPDRKEALARLVASMPFHPDVLDEAQAYCKAHEAMGPVLFGAPRMTLDDRQEIEWAAAYFVTSWMARAGSSGTSGEFDAPLATRWTAGGGDSNARYRSAVASIAAWHDQLVRCNFECMDGFEFIDRIIAEDSKPKRREAGAEVRGLYCDPPFPGPGRAYTHQLSASDQQDHIGQRRLASLLSKFETYRCVIRYYDDPLVRDMYPSDRWTWLRPTGGKTQTNDSAPEVLLVKKEAS